MLCHGLEAFHIVSSHRHEENPRKTFQESFYRQAKSENEKLVREKAALQPLDRAIGDLMGHMEKRKADATAGA